MPYPDNSGVGPSILGLNPAYGAQFVVLPEGQVLRLTGNNAAVGTVVRKSTSGSTLDTFTTGPGSQYFGPYSSAQSFTVAASAGSFTVKSQFDRPAALYGSVSTVTKAGFQGGITGTQLSDGISTGTTSRMLFRTPLNAAIAGLVISYCNAYISPTGEVNGPNPINVACALEVGALTTLMPLLGSYLTAIPPGVIVPSQLAGSALAKNVAGAVRTYVQVTLGDKFPQCRKAVTGEGTNGASGANIVSGNGSAGFSAANNMYVPCSITGMFTNNQSLSSIVFLGDSIAAGSGEAAPNAFGEQGYLERGFGNTLPWNTSTRSGTRYSDFNTASMLRVAAAFPFATHAVFQFGINDLGDGVTLAQLKTRAITAWDKAKAFGLIPIPATIGPYTTSTDSWATLVNQTIALAVGQELVRIQYNQWVRAGADGNITGYVEYANSVTDTADAAFWGVTAGSGYTAGARTGDGLHPNTNGVNASIAAPAINFSYF